MYTSPEVRDLGAVQALTLAGSVITGTGTVTKNNTNTADSAFGTFFGLPLGSNCNIFGVSCSNASAP